MLRVLGIDRWLVLLFAVLFASPALAQTPNITLSKSPVGNSVYGDPVEVTVSLSDDAWGRVVLRDDDGTFLDSFIIPVTGGSAVLSTTALSVGTHSAITVEYDPGPAQSPPYNATSRNFSHTVDQASTTTALSSSQNPSFPHSQLDLTATVSDAGSGTPTGTVSFYDAATLIGTASVDGSGQAVLEDLFGLTAGAHSLTAEYDGDTNFVGSTSAPLAQTVTAINADVWIISSINPSTAGQSVTFTAFVDQPPSALEFTEPTGTMTFTVDGTDVDTVAITGAATGSAAFTTSSLAVGSHSVTATYSGDDYYAEETTSLLTQVVNAVATTTVVTSSQNPSSVNNSVTFTASVSGGSTTPTGTVTFNVDGSDVASNLALVSGEATFTPSSLAVGSHTVVVSYSGDATNAASTSNTLTQVVDAVASTTVVTSSQNPSNFGGPVTFTANVSAASGTPAGTVSFDIDGSTVASGVSLVAGVASFATSTLAAGSHTVTANYSGDATYDMSSGSLTQTVNELGTITIAVTTDGSDGTFGFTSTTTALTLSVPTAGGTGQSSAVSLAAGSYSVSAASAVVAGFALTDITCSDADSTGNSAVGAASITLAAGEDVTCTFSFTNSREATTDLIEDFFSTRAELILGHGPDAGRRIDRLNGIVPSSGNPASALIGLMSIATTGGPRTLSGSLGAIEQAVGDRAEPAPFDIWFEGTFGLHASDSGEGNFGIAYLGADYLISPDFLVGALFQLDQVGFDSSSGDASAEGTGWMIGPYITGRLGDNLYFDVRAAAGRSANSVSPYGTYADEVDASRWLIDASIGGHWSDGSWTFEPAARLSYFEETSDAYTDGLGVYIPSVTTGKGQLALGPALSYRFVTDGEIEIVTGARLDGVLDFNLDGSNLTYDGAHAEIEASIDLSLPGGARLGASVKAGGLGEGDFRFLSGTVSVSAAIQ